MKINFFLILIMLLFQSCNNKTLDVQKNDMECDKCKNSVFYNHIYSYIKRTWEILLFDENGKALELPYYSYYFFEKDSIKYFTSWISYNNPRFIEFHNSGNELFYSNMNINGFDIILITEGSHLNKDIYSECDQLIFRDSIPLHSEKINYDWRWFVESYEYWKQDNIFVLKRLQEPITYFLGDVPKEFW